MTQDKKVPSGVRCAFCGRRNTVRAVDEKLYFCSHCERMFQA